MHRYSAIGVLFIACSLHTPTKPAGLSYANDAFIGEATRSFADRLPRGRLYTDAEIDRRARGFYAAATADLDAETLWPEAPSTETYRLTVLSSFVCTYLVRLDITAAGPDTLTLRGGGRYLPDWCTEDGPLENECTFGVPGPLLIDRVKTLDRVEATRITESLRAANVWGDVTPDPRCHRDGEWNCLGGGTIFLLEARSSDHFNFLERTSAVPAVKTLLEAVAFDPAELRALALEHGLRCTR
jgi:hypothetical protein